MEKHQPQVTKEHYDKKYDNLPRFISYFYQIDLLKKLKPKTALEVGIGNKTVANYLKQNGVNITTCDFDKDLEPDIVGDIRNLPIEDNSFDAVMACEILEHLPWDDFDKAVSELARVSKKHVIISIPYASVDCEMVLRLPFLGRIIKKPFLNLFFRAPYRIKDIEFNGQHYWELGRKSYPLKKIRKALKKHFKITEEVRPVINSYHYFFVLETV